MSSDNEYARSLVVCSLADILRPHFLEPIIQLASRSTRDHLVILLFSAEFENHLKWNGVQKLLTWVYVQSTVVAQDMGKVLLDVDVFLRGIVSSNGYDLPDAEFDVVYRFEGDKDVPEPPERISRITTIFIPTPSTDQQKALEVTSEVNPSFPVVALGGTFDHLHAGHKILLSMSAWIATQKVIVGVTDDVLLVNKSNKHLLQSIVERTSRIRAFLTLFKPSLELDIVPIDDVFGPTGWDPNIQALVVSKETLSGGAAIEKWRKEKGLPSLETFIIDVISAKEILDTEDEEYLKKTKMSSTFIRQWISAKEPNK